MSENIGCHIIRLKEIDSTNSYLKDKSELLQRNGLVVIAEMQVSGRGRAGRKFTSVIGNNVTFSVVLHPNLPLEEIQIFALLAGVAVARVLENYVKNIRLKWPNDVLVNEKKICGILLETINIPDHSFPVLIMGIGLNTKGCPNDYPEELQNIVTTIESEMSPISDISSKTESAPVLNNESIFQQLLLELDSCLEKFSLVSANTQNSDKTTSGRSSLLQEWLQRAKALGRKVCSLNNVEERVKDSGTVGIIEGLTREGYLQIRTDSGQILTHVSGDIFDMKR
ncbi:MAG TPA: biotin--[acetyl-CoA-carboxylase] ligase [Candidatus Lambdaproteobacteria bacterium]|jgi:BirA family biotin operon repressor/biotin-[acetyl-CoA-carboxylase] ligase|uniref:biotin--[biotin carboxyl-carrier protein] ligase n=2 Tax=SAR324 cluster bacterium TaxID=2024889 RepID=A0A432G0Q4_9DELT|nr:biotin--[acetyl-CoA-carboxylase] ligase [SAR324 cluster bacterium]RTZ77136.1 MAG: biotin--[acetyl-CoA-carboxylase] ligase [SAR324 cluster bacterium]HIA34528.1 biotin--[acetyl-CoA-carboxylase] ligase [Candidatus Lambdaproteobacteria bacterium]HIB17074.1 biotin--[acetyl-CoA-carboxylase] ligase [Candidatus Lambdaproteobacteria bacterium]HIC07962.1 biotin--[acetyl-CoA-carboxylase] ligase [Candidatus Lambdaproteobacteria bacterium]|tara:strand:- start:82 stop:927 length:846 start_codon:yes stop_codon:yes gene_type:complete